MKQSWRCESWRHKAVVSSSIVARVSQCSSLTVSRHSPNILQHCPNIHGKGSPKPSQVDVYETLRLRKLLDYLEITLIDHLIVGRDHAGVGDFYGAFDAQTIFDEKVPADALDIEIFKADHTAFSKKLGRVVMMSEAPDHTKEDFVILSGTKVREMLGQGIAPPPEFSRPEVAEILMDYYQNK